MQGVVSEYLFELQSALIDHYQTAERSLPKLIDHGAAAGLHGEFSGAAALIHLHLKQVAVTMKMQSLSQVIRNESINILQETKLLDDFLEQQRIQTQQGVS